MHVLNIYQIVRLLATRGHYSIDIIIGYFYFTFDENKVKKKGRKIEISRDKPWKINNKEKKHNVH